MLLMGLMVVMVAMQQPAVGQLKVALVAVAALVVNY
jgi:hypothetical protein